jgi:ABC-type branched-subunit amino acid transport system ATPase component
MAGFRYSRTECETRMERMFTLFPILSDRRSSRARDLSGGQRQMLALAMALMHDPEVLIIDELSLGLAPVAVQALLEVIDRLRAEGTTMIIVEQSLNIALSVTDRAILLEKGHVRFAGSTRELAARDDLAQTVFLGQAGAGR